MLTDTQGNPTPVRLDVVAFLQKSINFWNMSNPNLQKNMLSDEMKKSLYSLAFVTENANALWYGAIRLAVISQMY